MIGNLLLVMLGSAIGGGLRYVTGLAVTALVGLGFPWGTFVINILGCTVMGVFAKTIAPAADGGQNLRLLLMTGVLGGFTTYSAFALDAATLWGRNDIGPALFYVGGTLLLCLAGIALGLWIGQRLLA